MEAIDEQKFDVVKTGLGYRNEIGEMTGTQIYGYVATQLGGDIGKAESVLRELEEKGAATVSFDHPLDKRVVIEIRRL